MAAGATGYALVGDGAPPPPRVAPAEAFSRSTLDFVRTGRAEVYRPTDVRSVAVMLSGDGGWGSLNDRVAAQLARDGALVVGVDTNAWQQRINTGRGACHSAAADLQMLAQFTERRMGLARYAEPVLVGYSAGATIAFLAVEEAPRSFRGAISLSFPPDVLNQVRPFCTGKAPPPRRIENGFLYAPAPLRVPFHIVQGGADTVVPPGPARAFAAAAPGTTYTEVAGVGHGFRGWRDWWRAFDAAYAGMSGEPAGPDVEDAVADLPLVEVPAAGGAGDTFAVVLSGDGGWAEFDQSLAAGFAARGVPVVGWSSLKYFWENRPPAEGGADLARVIETYGARWNKRRVLLVGYSFGADALPFMIARLPAAVRARVEGFVSVAGSRTAEFQFSTADWFTDRQSGLPTLPAYAALGPVPVLCVYGREDADAVCPALPTGTAQVLGLPGGHHVGGDTAAIVAPALGLIANPAAG